MTTKKVVYRSQGLQLREAEDKQDEKIIEGYFVVFNDKTELWSGVYEQIEEGSIDLKRDVDVRALADHDSSKVLGRTTNGTLELKLDKKGLFGRIKLNEEDSDAMNLYARVKRQDINQCSFGFYVEEESTEETEGEVLFRIKKLQLVEVSVVTFPAYANTSVEARHKDFEKYRSKQLEIWKKKQKERINGSTKNIIS